MRPLSHHWSSKLCSCWCGKADNTVYGMRFVSCYGLISLFLFCNGKVGKSLRDGNVVRGPGVESSWM